jgi:hypothetical protein
LAPARKKHSFMQDNAKDITTWPWLWPGQIIRVIRLLVILVIVAAAARWEPGAALPLIAGVGLAGWLLTGIPAGVTA